MKRASTDRAGRTPPARTAARDSSLARPTGRELKSIAHEAGRIGFAASRSQPVFHAQTGNVPKMLGVMRNHRQVKDKGCCPDKQVHVIDTDTPRPEVGPQRPNSSTVSASNGMRLTSKWRISELKLAVGPDRGGR